MEPFFDPFSSITLHLIFSFLHLLAQFESLKVMIPLGRGYQLVIRFEEIYDNTAPQIRLRAIQVGTTSMKGYSMILKTQFSLPEALFVPEMFSAITSVVRYVLRRVPTLKLLLPLNKNGDKLMLRVEKVNHGMQGGFPQNPLRAIQIGMIRSKQGHVLLLKVRLR